MTALDGKPFLLSYKTTPHPLAVPVCAARYRLGRSTRHQSRIMNAQARADHPSSASPSAAAAHANLHSGLHAANADDVAAGRVLMPVCFRAEDVQAMGQARRWSDAAMQELQDLARLTDPVDEEAAEAALRQAIAENPCEVQAFCDLTELLSRQGRHDDALEVVDQALGWCNDVALLQWQAGRVLSAGGRSAQAIEAYHRALALDPTLADAHYELGLLYEDIGEPRRSARHFRACSRAMQSPKWAARPLFA